jgi:hypothetical protein
MREAVGHDAPVLSNQRSVAGRVAMGRAPEAEALGLAGERWHCLGAIPQDGGSPAIALLAVLEQLVQAMAEAKTRAGQTGCAGQTGWALGIPACSWHCRPWALM